MAAELLIYIFLLRVCLYDIRHHLIRNSDLLYLLLLLSLNYRQNFWVAVTSFCIYFALNFVFRGNIGSGDIKFSFICGFMLSDLSTLFDSIFLTWAVAGFFALFQRSKSLPFAPFMIFGTQISRFL